MSAVIPEAELRDQLLKENAEFRRLAAEHQSYDDQLENLSNKHFLSEEEQLQEKTLKKKEADAEGPDVFDGPADSQADGGRVALMCRH